MLFTKKFGWGQAGQGQRNVTVWKLVSWNVNGFFSVTVFPVWCIYCGIFIIVVVFVKWGIVVKVVVV